MTVLVTGAGPVGLAFACACPDAVQVIEAAPLPPPPADDFDLRIFALSAGTRSFLRDTSAWDRMDASRICPVRRMEVFGDAGARISFTGRGGGALAWIVEANRLAAALEAQAQSLANVTVRRGVAVADARADADGVSLGLADNGQVDGALLVGADGPDSRVRALLGLDAEEKPYGETAVVANFACEKPHGHAARQWFGREGVLAWLPLPGERISIVWSAPEALAQALLAMAPDELQARVRDAGAAVLGDLRLESRVAGFPLRLVRVARAVAPGAALIGDAAHGVHPLAGQGVNLGFQDARVLAEILAARSPLERPGDLRLLRRYARARREDVTAMQFLTDRLDRLFAAEGETASWLRNTGLRLVDAQPWAKRALASRAMR